MKHRQVFLSSGLESKLRSTDTLQQDCGVPAPPAQDVGLVFKQNGAGSIYPSPLSLAQGRQKTSVQKKKTQKTEEETLKKKKDKRPGLGLHSTGRSRHSTTGVQPRQNHFSQHAGVCEGNVSPRGNPCSWDGMERAENVCLAMNTLP